MPTSTPPPCPECGAARAPGALPADLCPRCLCALGLAGGEPDGVAGPEPGPGWLDALEPPRSGAAPVSRVLGPYRLLRRVGGGGMGVVYEAVDTRLDRRVAIKTIAPHLVADPETKHRFLQEARAASRLDHPNVCAVLDVGEDPELGLFLVMPFYDGETLARRLASGPLGLDEAVRLGAQLAAGLAAAHGAGVVHRDVKPGNLLVTREGVLKVLDFGLAKLHADAAITRAGTLAGTWAYMAPERVRGERADHRADLWSAGVVLYEALTGRLPFPGGPPAGAHHGPRRHPEPPRAHPALDDLVLRCLEEEPERRPASADALAAVLAGLASGAPSTAGGSPSPAPGARSDAARGGRGFLAAWLALTLAILAGVATLAGAGHGRGRAAGDGVEAPTPQAAAEPAAPFPVLKTADVGLAPDRRPGAGAGSPAPRRLYGWDGRLFLAVVPVLVLGAAALAALNLRRGWADRRRAARVAAAVALALALAWLVGGGHSAVPAREFGLAVVALGLSLAYGGLTWLLYLGAEPLLWRRSPDTFASWNLLLAGRWLDPAVGREVLVGTACGASWALLRHALAPPAPHPRFVLGGRFLAGEVLNALAASLVTALAVVALLVALELALRNRHAASAATAAVLAAAKTLPEAGSWPVWSVWLAIAVSAVLVLRRLGLLAFATAYLAARLLWLAPTAPAPLLLASVAALAVVGFWAAARRRSPRPAGATPPASG